MSQDDPVQLELAHHRATLTLNRPASHNALDAEAIATFHRHLDELSDRPDIRVVVITGSGDDTFCAGASLKQIDSGAMNPALFTTLTDRLDALPWPTICALNGAVFGGGVEVALCADFRIGVQGSRLRVPAAQLGLCYPLNGMRRFLSRLGLQTSRRLLLCGEELDAGQMLEVGFLDELVSADRLTAATNRLAERLIAMAPLAVAAMKQSLNKLAIGSVDEDALVALAAACAASEDLREGLAAQRERRQPRFRGR